MEINDNVLKEFANLMAGESETKNNKGVSTVYGTVTQNGDNTYVKIDGSEILTPVTEAMGAANGDRVIVMIKDHQAIITGNVTTPAVDNIEDIQELEKSVDVKFEVTDKKIEASISTLDGQLSSKIELTESRLSSEISNLETNTNSKFEQTDEKIESSVSALEDDDNELSSRIYQTANDISLVSSRVSSVEGEQTYLQSQITQNATNINLKVSADDVVSAINMSSDTIRLTTGRLVIDSGNFQLSGNGAMTCTSGKIGPYTINSNSLSNTSGTELWYNSIKSEFGLFNYIDAKTGSVIYVGGPDHVVIGDSSSVLRIEATVKAPGIALRSSTAAANIRLQSNESSTLALCTSSSARYKHYITDISNGELNPERLYDLPVRQYIYNTDYLDETDVRFNRYIPGFIAEEMDAYYPIATEYDEYGRPENWSERYIIPPMLALIQGQHTEIENLKNELSIIKEKMED